HHAEICWPAEGPDAAREERPRLAPNVRVGVEIAPLVALAVVPAALPAVDEEVSAVRLVTTRAPFERIQPALTVGAGQLADEQQRCEQSGHDDLRQEM